MRTIGVCFFLSLAISSADASERAAHLINSFQVMCTIEPLDFARSDAKATAMRLPVRQDLRSPPNPSGYFVHSKSWTLPLKSGPHQFAVTEAHGPKGDIKGCGIADAGVDPNDFKAELIKTLKLGRPAIEGAVSTDSTLATTVWKNAYPGLELMFSGRRDRTGVYLTLQTPTPK